MFHEMKNSEVNQSEKKQFTGSDGLPFFPDTCQGLVCSLNVKKCRHNKNIKHTGRTHFYVKAVPLPLLPSPSFDCSDMRLA